MSLRFFKPHPMVDPPGLRFQKNTRMLNPAPKNAGGWVPIPLLILPSSFQGCDKRRGLYRWPETTNISKEVLLRSFSQVVREFADVTLDSVETMVRKEQFVPPRVLFSGPCKPHLPTKKPIRLLHVLINPEHKSPFSHSRGDGRRESQKVHFGL